MLGTQHAEHSALSEITGVDTQPILNMRNILISLSWPINAKKFEELCHQTGHPIIDKYTSLPMTSTVHKIIVHSRVILVNTVLHIGYFGEAAECRIKIYKSDRLHHARKNSRINTDVFHRAMDTSDPIMSSLNLKRRIKKHKRLALPVEVIQLLACEVESADECANNIDAREDNNTYFFIIIMKLMTLIKLKINT